MNSTDNMNDGAIDKQLTPKQRKLPKQLKEAILKGRRDKAKANIQETIMKHGMKKKKKVVKKKKKTMKKKTKKGYGY